MTMGHLGPVSVRCGTKEIESNKAIKVYSLIHLKQKLVLYSKYCAET